jgi:hypothetical protein
VSALHQVADESADWRPGASAEARSVVSGLPHLTVGWLEPEAFAFGRGNGPLSRRRANYLITQSVAS